MSAVASHLSIEEFHRLYDGVKPNHEYWFGEAVAKTMPTYLHGIVQFTLMLLLDRLGWKVASEVTLKLVPDAEPIPDVIASRERIQQPYPTKPVDLCVEILSPEDRLNNAIRKARYYLDWGVRYVWIIDPVARTAWIVTRGNPEGEWIKAEGALKAEPDIEISLTELFAEVDKRI